MEAWVWREWGEFKDNVERQQALEEYLVSHEISAGSERQVAFRPRLGHQRRLTARRVLGSTTRDCANLRSFYDRTLHGDAQHIVFAKRSDIEAPH
jgi:hypothetical protein